MTIDSLPDRRWERIVRLICACCILPFSMCSHAQTAFKPFWYEPSHEKWVVTEFYKAAAFTAPRTRIQNKTRLLLVAEKQGWAALRVELVPGNPSLVFLPVRIFKSRLYRPATAVDSSLAFQNASLFEIDPDIIQRQLEGKDQESSALTKIKPAGKLKPWQKYKENWGSLTPPAKKNKYLLLDDIKQPEEAPETPP